jgi:uncharacterized cupredoxin-like copper-binding protein
MARGKVRAKVAGTMRREGGVTKEAGSRPGRPPLRFLAGLIAILAGGLLALGCGTDNGTVATTVSSPAYLQEQLTASHTVTIKMGDYYYKPDIALAKAGSVTITAANIGKIPHELVLARTDAAPSALPTLPDGSVDEDKIEAQDRAPGEISETEAGISGKVTLKLPAGHYVMYCNIPGHYVAGMYGALVVE